MIPENKENEFYGFAFGKATSFLGPFLFTLIVSITNDLRYGIAMIAILFVIGFFLMNLVKEEFE